MIACLYSSSDIVKLLLKHGVQLSSSDNQGASSIHYAVWGGDIRCVKLVVSRGGRTVLSQRDQWGRTPLLIAAAKVRTTCEHDEKQSHKFVVGELCFVHSGH